MSVESLYKPKPGSTRRHKGTQSSEGSERVSVKKLNKPLALFRQFILSA